MKDCRLLQGHWHKWTLIHNGCWMSCWRINHKFHCMVDVNTQNSRIWALSNSHEYQIKPLPCSDVVSTVWCDFTELFILASFFFFWKILYWIDWETCTVTSKRYITLLRDHVLPALKERRSLPVATFMQVGVLVVKLVDGRFELKRAHLSNSSVFSVI